MGKISILYTVCSRKGFAKRLVQPTYESPNGGHLCNKSVITFRNHVKNDRLNAKPKIKMLRVSSKKSLI